MIQPRLRSVLVSVLLAVPSVAWAGGGGSSSSSTGGSSGSDSGSSDSGSDSGTSGSSGSGSDSGTTGGSSSTGEPCRDCTPLDEPVQIVSPANGDLVAPTFDVRITAPYTCSCDTMCCTQFDPFSVSVRANGMTVESCSQASKECNTRDQTFTITLPPGTHVLDAAAQVGAGPEFSESIEVTVPGMPGEDSSTGAPPPPPPPPPTPGTSSSSSSTGSGGAADGGGGGCGCRSDAESPLSAGVLAIVMLSAFRRRRG